MSLWRDTLVPALAPRVAYAYIRALRATMRLEYRNRAVLDRAREGSGNYILAFWHSRYVMMPYVYPDTRIAILSSAHRDSRMLGEVLERFGFTLAVGSSTRGGTRGLRELLRRVREGFDVGITPDGPRGPRRRVKPGVIVIARLTGLPIIPVAFSSRPARRLRSWDRTLVPYPFTRGTFFYGDPLRVPRDADPALEERLRGELEAAIDSLTDRADTHVGLGLEDARPAVET